MMSGLPVHVTSSGKGNSARRRLGHVNMLIAAASDVTDSGAATSSSFGPCNTE